MTRQLSASILLALSLLLASCAADRSLPGEFSLLEPTMIALRNSSQIDLRSMAVQEPRSEKPNPTGVPLRMGSISPLLKGRTYTIMRRANAEPLPDRALVIFTDQRGATREIKVDLRPALGRSRGGPTEALVIDYTAGGNIRVYLDDIEP